RHRFCQKRRRAAPKQNLRYHHCVVKAEGHNYVLPFMWKRSVAEDEVLQSLRHSAHCERPACRKESAGETSGQLPGGVVLGNDDRAGVYLWRFDAAKESAVLRHDFV